jgi:hypothetical protein
MIYEFNIAILNDLRTTFKQQLRILKLFCRNIVLYIIKKTTHNRFKGIRPPVKIVINQL